MACGSMGPTTAGRMTLM
ncbi:hypothetical protein [Bacteroides acidifaciens]